jgi:predicted O-methyltransferase YrrM
VELGRRLLANILLRPDAALDATLTANRAAGLPSIDVAPNQGKLLYLLAQMLGACNILEIGTLGAYSTIWLARALPADGHLITLEADPKHAEVARANLVRAGLAQVVDVRVGVALDTLPALVGQIFDLVFIDADKPNNAAYLEWALRLARPGSVIIVDNVVRAGGILDATSNDPRIQGTRRLFEAIAQEPRLEATAIQTVGRKGHDGFVLARVVPVPRSGCVARLRLPSQMPLSVRNECARRGALFSYGLQPVAPKFRRPRPAGSHCRVGDRWQAISRACQNPPYSL